MSILDASPVVTNEGAGFQRGGTQAVAKDRTIKIKGRRPVRRFVPKVTVKGHARGGAQIGPHVRRFPTKKQPVTSESESNPNVASFHTSKVNAPLGYQGLFYGH